MSMPSKPVSRQRKSAYRQSGAAKSVRLTPAQYRQLKQRIVREYQSLDVLLSKLSHKYGPSVVNPSTDAGRQYAMTQSRMRRLRNIEAYIDRREVPPGFTVDSISDQFKCASIKVKISSEQVGKLRRQMDAERAQLDKLADKWERRPSSSDAIGYASSPKGRALTDIRRRLQRLEQIDRYLDNHTLPASSLPTVTLTQAEIDKIERDDADYWRQRQAAGLGHGRPGGKGSQRKAQYPSLDILVHQAPGFATKLQLAAEVLADAAATAKAAGLIGAATAAQSASAAIQSAAHQAGIPMRAIAGYAASPYESVLNLASAIAAMNTLQQQLAGVPGGEGLLRAVYGARMQAAGVRERLKGGGGKGGI